MIVRSEEMHRRSSSEKMHPLRERKKAEIGRSEEMQRLGPANRFRDISQMRGEI